MIKIKDDLSIVLSGEAGQGIQSIEVILTYLLKKSGYNIFATKEYMSRVRGGVNSTLIRVSSCEVRGFIDRIDILIPLKNESIDHLRHRISEKTVVIGDKDKIKYDGIVDVSFSTIAMELGNEIYSNTIAVGVVAGLLNISLETCENHIRSFFAKKTGDIVDKNIEALGKGYEKGGKIKPEVVIELKKSDSVTDDIVLTGSDAVALGAIAGGCDYVCAYPMSPSTGVLEKMADYSKKFGIIVEQVEDEVGVINMALGAWYAGARALVTTSGGGFALMSEGLSLCGIIESPLVVHLAQRPGPATGLPTRTEQGDLNLVLYAGHGEFPRIIFAPGNLGQGFELTRKAFGLADMFQVPVIILTDQFYVDSYYNTPAFVAERSPEKNIVVTKDGYKRYDLSSGVISSRGIPGNGEGCVNVDSDEHDESGHITESGEMRNKMVVKRSSKLEPIEKEISEPDLYGEPGADIAVICWGSTLNTVLEAVGTINDKNMSVLHYSWIYPLYKGTAGLIKNKRNIIIENNETSQFAQLIMRETGINISDRILKCDGMPFSTEEIKNEILKIVKG